MCKKIVMSLVSTAAISLGGYMFSCGSGEPATTAVIVQLPEGCTMISPKDSLGALGSGTPVVTVHPGKIRFVVDCGNHTAHVEKEIQSGQHSLTLTEEDLR